MSIARRELRTGQRAIVISAGLSLLTLCVFWQVRGFGFIKFDDPAYVTVNPHVLQGLTLAGLKWAFTGVHGDNWHPVTSLSHLLDVQIFGLSAGMHHLVNLALHVANVLLLFAVLRCMTGTLWRSGLVAVLFAIHPLRVESVVWISERKDVLSGFFWMLSLLAYHWYARQPALRPYLTTLGLFALGLLAKPMVVTLPFVLLLLDFWPLRRLSFSGSANFLSSAGEQLQSVSRPRIFLEKAPFLAFGFAAGLMTLHAQRAAMVSVGGLPLQIRLFNSVLAYVAYLKKSVWPVHLAIFYPFQRHFSLNEIAAAVFLLLALSFVAIVGLRTRPYLLTGWLWYLVTLLPVIGLVQVGSQSYADRYTYLPTVGLYIIVAWSLSEIVQFYPPLRIPMVTTSLLAIGGLSALTFTYASVWRSDDLLLQHTLEVTKDNAPVHCTIGTKLLDEGRYEQALDEFRQALSTTSGLLGGEDYSEAHVGMGLALFALGRSDEAVKSFRRAIELAPKVARTHVDLGISLDKLGQWQESLHEFEEAARLSPDEPFTHSNLAIAYLKRGRVDEAVAQYREALRVYPNQAESLAGLAWLLATDPEASRRNGREALRLATQACKLSGLQDPNGLRVLAAAQAETNDFITAVATAEKALDLVRKQGPKRDRALEQELNVALGLYQAGFAYHRQ